MFMLRILEHRTLGPLGKSSVTTRSHLRQAKYISQQKMPVIQRNDYSYVTVGTAYNEPVTARCDRSIPQSLNTVQPDW